MNKKPATTTIARRHARAHAVNGQIVILADVAAVVVLLSEVEDLIDELRRARNAVHEQAATTVAIRAQIAPQGTRP